MSTSEIIPEPLAGARNAAADEVLTGLSGSRKRIAPKFFYDRKGSQLFDEITNLDEYYVPRVEEQIFVDNRDDICAGVGSGSIVLEPGAGSCEKIRWLLPELEPAVYKPMDISGEHLKHSARALREDYPDIRIEPVVCDHTAGLDVFDVRPDDPVVYFYPGSSIGNFEPAAAVNFMQGMCRQMEQGGGLLIGVDTKKETEVLHAAYNDSRGVTAKFNLNVLEHLNELLCGDLDTAKFSHVARYDASHGRIEMYLRSQESHSATLAGQQLEFAEGEMIHTENSYKYHPQEFAELAREAGFTLSHLWQDARAWFSVMLFRPVG